jgi:hypothetical protein
MSALALAILAAAVLVAAVGVWAQARLVARVSHRTYRGKFFAVASEIIPSEECPLELAFALRVLGSGLTSSAVLRIIIFDVLTGGRFARPSKPILTAFEDAPKAVKKRFREASGFALTAISYRSVVFGPLIRRKLNGGNSVDKSMLGDVVRYGERHDVPSFLECTEGGFRLKANPV